MRKTLVAWRRLGKEHGEEEFKVNPPEVVAANLREKIASFRGTPAEDWRWYQFSDELIVERPGGGNSGPETVIYYLPRRCWAIIEDARFKKLGREWTWYVHLGAMEYDPEYQAWIFTDYFCDVIVKRDLRTHSVLDLDDLGDALRLSLVDVFLAGRILASTQELVDLIRAGGFPPEELREREAIRAELFASPR